MQSLSGKIVIITGASTGIGAATARKLVPMGCKVVLTARSFDKLENLARELGPAALAVPGDVTNAADVENVVSRTVSAFGGSMSSWQMRGFTSPGKSMRAIPMIGQS